MTLAPNQPAGGCPMAAVNPKTSERVYVCAFCQQSFIRIEDHDFDLCEVQYRMELKWKAEKGEVIYVN